MFLRLQFTYTLQYYTNLSTSDLNLILFNHSILDFWSANCEEETPSYPQSFGSWHDSEEEFFHLPMINITNWIISLLQLWNIGREKEEAKSFLPLVGAWFVKCFSEHIFGLPLANCVLKIILMYGLSRLLMDCLQNEDEHEVSCGLCYTPSNFVSKWNRKVK